MIKVIKEYEGNWTVWNKENGKTASIIQFDDGFLGKPKKRYRIDVAGKTQETLISHFQTAQKKAKELVQV